MNDSDVRDRQLALLADALRRTDLARGEIVVFTDMRSAISNHGAILSEAQENWIRNVNNRPMPDLAKVEAVAVPAAWRPLTLLGGILWIVCFAVGLVVFQICLTFMLRWLGWR